MQRNSARLLLLCLFLAGLWSQCLTLANAAPSLKGLLVDRSYTSPSGKLRCDLDEYVSSPGFFVNEAYDPGESETMSFGFDAGTHFELWTIRRQREGRLEFAPLVKEGFSVNSNSFIPYFYSELPYKIQSLGSMGSKQGRSEVLQVQMDDQVQLHAYWLDQRGKWLNSIQFLPTLVNAEKDTLEKAAVKRALEKLKERCTFG